MGVWNPWRGCHRLSEGCRFCYLHKGDQKKGIDTDVIIKSEKFDFPVQKKKNGDYKMKSGQTVYVCFSSDFLIEEADSWRSECWRMIKIRKDLNFIFLTKRINRLIDQLPNDWKDGYDNVTVGCTVEDNETVERRLPIFLSLPIKHKIIICQPLIERVDLSRYLDGVEIVVAGGEADKDARPLNYEWILEIREQCINKAVKFEFRQCGSRFIRDGLTHRYNAFELSKRAKELNIDI